MGTYLTKKFGSFVLDYGRGDTDSLTISDTLGDIQFWNEDIDDLIQAIEEIKNERERIKEIDKE